MPKFETDGDARRARSLLALGAAPGAGERARAGGSLLKAPVKQDVADAAARHRLARSRREAAKSPLMKALAKTGQARDKVVDRSRPTAEQAAREEKPASGLRSLLRDRVFGREEHDVPAAGGHATAFGAETAPRRETRSAPERSAASPQPRAGVVPAHTAVQAPRDPAGWRPMIDPVKVISGIANARLLTASLTVAGALLGVIIALSTPKTYESVAEMLVDPRDLRMTDREITTSGLPSDATLAIVENQVRVLTSGTVLNKVVDELNLTNDPEFNGEADGGLLGAISNWRALFQRNAGDDGGARKRAMTVDNLGRSLSVERGGKTFVVSVGVTTESPDKSALIANTMTRVFLDTYGRLQSNTAGRAADELNSRLDELRREVEEAERRVETFKAEKDLIGSQGRLISEDEIVTLNTQLSVARARTLELNAKAASARAVSAEAALSGALPEELTSNVMTELRSQYAALKSESDRLSARLGPRHPQRMAIEAQLAGARAQIDAELRRIAGSFQVELRRAVQLEQQLASRLAQLKVGQGGVNSDLVTLREFEREASAKRAVYESFLLRAKETGEQRDINAANVSVISEAFPPIVSVGPSRAITVLGFMFAGFLGGIGIGGIRGAWRSLRDDAAARHEQWREPDTGVPAPEPTDGGPGGGARGRGPERTNPDEPPASHAPRDGHAPTAVRLQAEKEIGETIAARPSGWLDLFRRRLRQDEASAATDIRVAPPAQPYSVAGISPQEAVPAQPTTWQPVQPMPIQQPAPAWQAAAAHVAAAPAPMQAPAHVHAAPMYQQPVYQQPAPAMQAGSQAYQIGLGGYPQPVTPYPQATPMQTPAFVPAVPQPMPAFVQQPFVSAGTNVFAAQPPVAAMPHHVDQPYYPYPVPPQYAPAISQQRAPVAQAYARPPHVVPVYPAAIAQPAPVASPWDEDDFSARDRGPARSVEELRDDLREFRAAILDLAESRVRRRHA